MVNLSQRDIAAAWLGIFVFAIVLLIYVPTMLTRLPDIAGGLNYAADTLLYSGAILLIAGVLPGRASETLVSRVGAATRERARQADSEDHSRMNKRRAIAPE